MRVLAFAFVALSPGLALAAGGKPQPADKHEPALFVDHGADWINVVGYDHDYSVNGSFRIYGATNEHDRGRLEWKSGGKLIDSAPCQGSYHEKGKLLDLNCTMDKHPSVTGPIDADLIYIDDQTDTEYLVTTFHVTVKSWNRVGNYKDWGILPDDLLAVAYIRHWYGPDDDTFFHKPLFEFWSSAAFFLGDAQLRCTVDGKRLPDFKAHIDKAHGAQQTEVEVSVNTPNSQRKYSYEHLGVDPDFHFGPKDQHGIYDPTKMNWVIDNPGKWDCMLRKDGHQVRQFLFTVNDKGMVEQSEMQKGGHPAPTMANVVLIDMKIPADNGVEKRIRPDAMKKSIGFGVPWPDGARAKEMQAAFPPSSGLPD
jgi:hypothetical protein